MRHVARVKENGNVTMPPVGGGKAMRRIAPAIQSPTSGASDIPRVVTTTARPSNGTAPIVKRESTRPESVGLLRSARS